MRGLGSPVPGKAIETVSRPFDRTRDGFVLGEGAGSLILEDLELAKARGAKIYAEIVGYGSSADGYDMIAPAPHGEGAARAMKNALERSGVPADEVDMADLHSKATTNAGPIDATALLDDDLNTAVTIAAPAGGGPAWLQYEFAQPFQARAISLAGRGGIPVGRVLSSESIRIKIQREIHNLTMGRPGGNLRVVTHPILCEVLKKKLSMIEKNVHRSVKIMSDPQLTWEDYRIILE